jgi:hypothetical protein
MYGLGFFLLVAFILSVLWVIRRGIESAAFRAAEKAAGQGQHAQAIREVLKAEQRWGFNTAHDVRSTRVAALDRLDKLVRFACAQAEALGRPIDAREVGMTTHHLRHLLGTKEHYSWGSETSLKGEFKQHVGPLMAQLTGARQRFRAACSQVSS